MGETKHITAGWLKSVDWIRQSTKYPWFSCISWHFDCFSPEYHVFYSVNHYPLDQHILLDAKVSGSKCRCNISIKFKSTILFTRMKGRNLQPIVICETFNVWALRSVCWHVFCWGISHSLLTWWQISYDVYSRGLTNWPKKLTEIWRDFHGSNFISSSYHNVNMC